MRHSISKIIFVSLLMLLNINCSAEIDISTLGERWSKAIYELEGNAQKLAFEELILDADDYIENNQRDPSGWVWRGIIKSSFAGVIWGLESFPLAKQAETDLLEALSLDSSAMSGTAHMSLGLLYAKVPDWPFGFGNQSKAEQHLIKALQLNPNDMDSNFFYGEFLYSEKKQYLVAKKYLIKAQDSKAAGITPIADESRQKQISILITQVEKKLRRKNKRAGRHS